MATQENSDPPANALELDLAALGAALPQRIEADPVAADHGLAKLVLTLIEFVRRLLELQAMRRVESGSLSEDEVERMGETFLRLNQKLAELKAAFALADEDLTLNLGPLGELL